MRLPCLSVNGIFIWIIANAPFRLIPLDAGSAQANASALATANAAAQRALRAEQPRERERQADPRPPHFRWLVTQWPGSRNTVVATPARAGRAIEGSGTNRL